jgi:hypothetical protein
MLLFRHCRAVASELLRGRGKPCPVTRDNATMKWQAASVAPVDLTAASLFLRDRCLKNKQICSVIVKGVPMSTSVLLVAWRILCSDLWVLQKVQEFGKEEDPLLQLHVHYQVHVRYEISLLLMRRLSLPSFLQWCVYLLLRKNKKDFVIKYSLFR